MKLLLIGLVFFITNNPASLRSIELKDIDNASFSFQEIGKSKGTVIVFLLTDCPASQSYTLTLNKMAEKYALKKIRFIGVFPGKFSQENEMKDFRKIYKITFPLVKDPDLKLAHELKADVAPGSFLIDQKGEIVYSGRIDDWMYAVGKKKPGVTTHDLDNAIQSLLNNKPIRVKKTQAIGCIIES